MKKLLLLALPLMLLSGCKTSESGVKGKDYFTFNVETHFFAQTSSEPQETTHDPYLAYCINGDNVCYIEVATNDNRKHLNLVHRGYIINYQLNGRKFSNNGWYLYD